MTVHFRNYPAWYLIAAFVACLAVPAAASNNTIHIRHDTGGDLRLYQIKAQVAREMKLRVVIDGLCASACTVLVQLPRAQVCATPRARLGFHRAALVRPVTNGHALVHRANYRLIQSYPAGIRRWIDQRGGLTRRVLMMGSHDVQRFIRPCRATDLR